MSGGGCPFSKPDSLDHGNGDVMAPETAGNGVTSSRTQQQLNAAAWWLLCDFSTEELFILRSSFGAVKHRLENVAVAAFISLFDQRPDAFAVFIGKKVLPSSRNDVEYSWETKQHGLRVLSVVERCLNRIDKWELFQDVVSSLAVRHLRYGAKPVYILALFGCLRQALLNEMEKAVDPTNAAAVELSSSPPKRGGNANHNCHYELGVKAINSAWNKFFRTLGLALVAEMLTLQENILLTSEKPLTPTTATATAPPQQTMTPSSSAPISINKKESGGKNEARETKPGLLKTVTSKLNIN